MPRIEECVNVAAPPATLFRFCHDVARRPGWDERVTRVEILTSNPKVGIDYPLGAILDLPRLDVLTLR